MEKVFFENYKTTFFPVPIVVVSVDGLTRPNIITLGWSGILNSEPLIVGISVRPSRFTNSLLHEKKVFGLNIPNTELVSGVDLSGVVSGRDRDKLEELNWHTFRGTNLDVPLIEEFPINAECLVKDIVKLGTHELFLAEVKGVYIKREYLDGSRVDWSKLNGLVYGSKTYFKVNDPVFISGESLKPKK